MATPGYQSKKTDSDAWRDEVIAEAKTWLGTPYQHKGRVKGVGVDCGGLLYQVYKPWRPDMVPFPKDYPPDWALHRENDIYLDFIRPYTVEVVEPIKGGMALFLVGRSWSHAAIMTEKLRYLHSWGRNGHGCVTISGKSFFTVGETGKPREVRYFDLVR